MNKKAALSMQYMVILILLAIVLFFAGSFIVKEFAQAGISFDALGIDADNLCKIKSPDEDPWVDIDGDDRHDNLCDNCVCKTGCHNDNDDSDHDSVPDICDAVDDDKTKFAFDKTVCPEDQITYLGEAYGYRCMP